MLKKVLSVGGQSSQTGEAVRKRFPKIQLSNVKKSWQDLATLARGREALVFLPAWNLHAGEVTQAQVVDLLFGQHARIHELWPGRIRFVCGMKRMGKLAKGIRVVSVNVAREQCSSFLRKWDASFEEKSNTMVAVDEFCKSRSWDVVLCPPGLRRKTLEIKPADIANDFNITTFTLMGNVARPKWKGKHRRGLTPILAATTDLFGVEMDVPYPTFSSEEAEFFESLERDVASINEIPRALFVIKRSGGRCAILFEKRRSGKIWGPPNVSPTDTGVTPPVSTQPALGESHAMYCTEILDLLNKEYPKVRNHEFISFTSSRACLFACPKLGLAIQGYDSRVAEVIARKMIGRIFSLITDGVSCSPAQNELYQRHRQKFRTSGDAFFSFHEMLEGNGKSVSAKLIAGGSS